MSKHHTILLPLPILPAAIEPIYLLLKVTSVKVLPNGNLANKEEDFSNTYQENININSILFITAANYLKNNHVLLRLYEQGNNCLLIQGTMIEILVMFSAVSFMQIHDSYSINKNFAISVCPHIEINLFNYNLPLPISRSFSDDVDKVLFPNRTFHYGKSCPNKNLV